MARQVHGMSRKRPPTIGVTCAELQQDPLSPRIGQNRSYVRALVRAGAAPLLIPPLTDRDLLHALYERLDGLLLPGGGDVHPARYGEPIHEKCGSISPDRDEAELALAQWAMDDGLPLLGICRGIQVLNVALGGSLYQDIQAQVPGAERHDWGSEFPRDYLSHLVTVAPETRLAHLLESPSLPVNSMHHQALKDIASRLAVTARTPDGIVEGIEAGDHPFAVAVQWHPEELAEHDPRAQRLFDALVEACCQG
jgi:putative glutamine amidotransferase